MRSGWSWHTCTAVPRARPLGLKNVFLNSGYPVKKLQHGNAARNQTTGTDETQAVLMVGKSRFPPGRSDGFDSVWGGCVCWWHPGSLPSLTWVQATSVPLQARAAGAVEEILPCLGVAERAECEQPSGDSASLPMGLHSIMRLHCSQT